MSGHRAELAAKPGAKDQQLGGVIMLLVGAAVYLAGGLLLIIPNCLDDPAELWIIDDIGSLRNLEPPVFPLSSLRPVRQCTVVPGTPEIA